MNNRLIKVLTGVISILFILSVNAEELVTHPVLRKVVTAPINDSVHYGNINGIKIAIPREYWASVLLATDSDPVKCNKKSQSPSYYCNINTVSLFLRRNNLEPIYDREDFNEFTNNFLSLNVKKWVEIDLTSDLYLKSGNTLDGFYKSAVKSAVSNFGKLTCDSKYNLEHCYSKNSDGPLIRNEFFFNKLYRDVFIECSRIPDKSGAFLSCKQYMLMPSIKSVAVSSVSSDEDISRWQDFFNGVKNISDSMRVTN